MIRPWWLRPPVLDSFSVSAFSGRPLWVTSAKSLVDRKRVPGVTGLNCLVGISLHSLEELDRVALGERHAALGALRQRMDAGLGFGVAARLVSAQDRLEGPLEIRRVGRRTLVEDDEIDGQSLHSPVLVGAQKLANDLEILDLVEAR